MNTPLVQAQLIQLVHWSNQLRVAQRRCDEAAVLARRAGATWEEIGAVLGMSRQLAFYRYGNGQSARTQNTLKHNDDIPARA